MEALNVYSMPNNTRKNALDFIQKKGLTKEAFAKEINVSRTLVSKYLNGKYDANADNIENAITEYLKTQGEWHEVTNVTVPVERPSFYKTKDAADIIGVCKACQEYKSLGIIVGKSGYGKTYALKQYSKMQRVCYIECDDTMSCRDLVEAVEKKLGLPTGYGSIWKRVSGIKEFFSVNQGYLLIVDEADKLISKYTQKKMEILRAIFDQNTVGVVIAGEPKLEILVRSYLNRFANRVDFYSSLKGLRRDEVKGFLEGLNFTEDAVEEMIIRATNTANGCFRLLDRTLKNIYRLVSSGEEVTIDIIRKASGMMML